MELNVRVYKTVSNGNVYLGNPVALTVGVNTITVLTVTFDRAVKFQFSSGDVEFDALTLNGVARHVLVQHHLQQHHLLVIVEILFQVRCHTFL